MQTLTTSTFQELAGPVLAAGNDYPPKIQAFAETSNFGFENDIPHPAAKVEITAHLNGMLVKSEYSGSTYYGLLNWPDIISVAFHKRYKSEIRPQFNLFYFFICAVIVAISFTAAGGGKVHTAGILFNAVFFGAVLGGIFSILYPEKNYCRLFTITCTGGQNICFKIYEGDYGKACGYFMKYLPAAVHRPV